MKCNKCGEEITKLHNFIIDPTGRYLFCEPCFSEIAHREVTKPSGIEMAVCDDISARQAKGIAKYGTTVADNPLELKEWLQHAYEETLDKAVYLKRAIREL